MSALCLSLQDGALSTSTAVRESAGGQACDVFICYHEQDVKDQLVGHIKERLKRANLVVFVDCEMRKGNSWPHVLATLRNARSVLILLTPGFEGSPWCLEEVHAVAARLLGAERVAGARQYAVLPVSINREASWDEGRLPAAFKEFTANRDFDQLRAEEPGLAARVMEHWRRALDSVAQPIYLMHRFNSSRFDAHSKTDVCFDFQWHNLMSMKSCVSCLQL